MVECIHEWIFLEKKVASEPSEDAINLQKYIGEEYVFFCKKCLELKTKIIKNNFTLEYLFNPFPNNIKKGNNKIEIPKKDLIDYFLKIAPCLS